MFENLPEELITLVLGFLAPRDLQSLQCTTRINLLPLYRLSQGYGLQGQDEKAAFLKFYTSFFYKHLYDCEQIIPYHILRKVTGTNMALIGVPILRSMVCTAHNMHGVTLLAAYKTHLPPQQNIDWKIYLSLIVNARHGNLPILSREHEISTAIALVKYSRQKSVQEILRFYQPQTPEMVMCMLHFNMNPPVPPKQLLSQDLCDYWFLRTLQNHRQQLVNSLPDFISLKTMLGCNPRLFIAMATKKTLTRFGVIRDRVKYVRQIPYFFPALITHRKKCGLKISDLVELGNLHIETHGSINYLLTHNTILQRSKVFRPDIYVLRKGATRGDPFFKSSISQIPYLTSSEIDELQRIADIACERYLAPKRLYLPYIFSAITDVCVYSREDLLAKLALQPGAKITCRKP